jgi:hypothetical protein
VAAATQYPISLTVSDGELSSTTTYTAERDRRKQTNGGQTGTYPTWSAKTKKQVIS